MHGGNYRLNFRVWKAFVRVNFNFFSRTGRTKFGIGWPVFCSEQLSEDWHVAQYALALSKTVFKKRHDYVTVLSDQDAVFLV